MLNFNHLYYFHVTASEGSVKGAADRLGVTQPTVSEQVRMLERTLGLPLFERTSSGLRLTQRGREAYEHTTAMFLAGERLLQALAPTGTPSAVALRVGISSAVSRMTAADFLMPVLTFEKCRPSIRTGDFNDLLRDLRSHEIDVLIGETEPIEAARPDIDLAIVHRPALIAIANPKATPRADWSDLSILGYRSSSAYHWEVDTFLKEKGLRPAVMGELDDAFLMLEAVARGDFVAFVPKSVARHAIALGRVKILAEFLPKSTGVHAMYHRSDNSTLARAVVEKLIENAKKQLEEN